MPPVSEQAFQAGQRLAYNDASPGQQSTTTMTQAEREKGLICELPELGVIRVSGPDARTFLQGQLTNDIDQVTPDRGQLSAHCTPKGRMLAIFLIFQQGEDLFLVLPRERLPAMLQRLRMFVLRAQVRLEDVSDTLPLHGIGGEIDETPGEPWATAEHQGSTWLRLPGPSRWLVAGPAEGVNALDAQAAPEGWWRLMNVRGALPMVYEATAEAWVPQMCNLDLLGGISFSKGCYTGQEVVARMKYLGQLKRRMYRARCSDEAAPKPGDALFSPESKSAQGAGMVVEAAPSPEGGHELLIVTQISLVESGAPLHLGAEEGPQLATEPEPAQA